MFFKFHQPFESYRFEMKRVLQILQTFKILTSCCILRAQNSTSRKSTKSLLSKLKSNTFGLSAYKIWLKSYKPFRGYDIEIGGSIDFTRD